MYRCRYFAFTCFHWLKLFLGFLMRMFFYPYTDSLLPFVDSVCWSTATANSEDQCLFSWEKNWRSHILTLPRPAQLHRFYGNFWKTAHLWSCLDGGLQLPRGFPAPQPCSAVQGGGEDVLFPRHVAVQECWAEQVHWPLWLCCSLKSEDSRKYWRFWHTQCISIFQEV